MRVHEARAEAVPVPMISGLAETVAAGGAGFAWNQRGGGKRGADNERQNEFMHDGPPRNMAQAQSEAPDKKFTPINAGIAAIVPIKAKGPAIAGPPVRDESLVRPTPPWPPGSASSCAMHSTRRRLWRRRRTSHRRPTRTAGAR